jgi:hypothetical protein
MMEARSDGSHGDVEGFGYLRVGKLLGEAQVQNLTLKRGQRIDNLEGERKPRIGFIDGQSFRGSSGQGFAIAVTAFPGGLADVAGDAEKIGPEGAWLSTILEAARHFEKGLLHEILRRLRSAVMTAGEVSLQVVRSVPEKAIEIGLGFDGSQLAEW